MKYQVTKETFAKDVAEHQLSILLDDGVYRHIRCAKPETGNRHFEIVTFPGYLVYVGDMGAYTFWRIKDMFEFFRRDDNGINPGYWSEKVEARDRDGITEFSRDKFAAHVLETVREQLELDDDAPIPEDVEYELGCIRRCDDSEHECMSAIRDFEHEKIDFSDAWEWDNHVYTTRFLWCCHAIVWAIARYNEAKKQ